MGYIIFFTLVLGCFFMYIQLAGGVLAVTGKIKTRWLRIAVTIITQVIIFCLVAVGVICTFIVALSFGYGGKKSK